MTFHGTTEVVPFPFLSLWSASGVSNSRFLDSAVPFTSLQGPATLGMTKFKTGAALTNHRAVRGPWCPPLANAAKDGAADSVVAYWSRENKSEDAQARPFPFLLLWSASGVSNSRFLDSAVPFTSPSGAGYARNDKIQNEGCINESSSCARSVAPTFGKRGQRWGSRFRR